MLDALSQLSAVATTAHPGPDDLVRACGLIRDALGAADAYVLRAGDPHYVRVGDNRDPTQYEIKQKGYWLVWRDLVTTPEAPAAAFVVKDRIVQGGEALASGLPATHVAAILPAAESNSEMLIIDGPWPDGLSEEACRFIIAARPILAYLAGNALDSEREARLRDQLNSLADVSKAFNEASDMNKVVQDIANALAKASGFDWVTVLVVNETCDEIVERALNGARYSGTDTAHMGLNANWDIGRIKELARSRQPLLLPDVFAPEAHYTADLTAFYERAHILSVATFPVMYQDEMVGAVNFSSSTKRDFGESEVAFLDALISQAASSIKGMLLYHGLERSREELRRYSEQLEEMSQAQHFLARSDALTGIPNRRYIEEVLKAEVARSKRYGQPVSVVMADIDRFKGINDSFGHQSGDEALRFVATLARETCRTADFVGRWGGDEFFFILPACEVNDALTFADRFRTILEESSFTLRGAEEPVQITISAGVAQAVSETSGNPDHLVDQADKALYMAKESGRNRVLPWHDTAAAA